MNFQNRIYSYSYSHDFLNPNSIRIRIRLKFKNRIVCIFLSFNISFFLMVCVLIFGIIRIGIRYYSNNLSIRIHIQLKFKNRRVCIFPKVKIWNFLLCLLAQRTQYAIFTVLSFNISCFLMVFVLIFGIIRISIRYYSNNLSIRIRIRTKVALRIVFVFVFGQISEPE